MSEEKWEIGYKALTRLILGNRHFSLLMHWHVPLTEYFTDKITERRPGCGPFAVFDTLEHLRDFLNGFDTKEIRRFEVWKCKFVRSTETSLYYITNDGWEERISCSDYPIGVIFADKVILLEEVKP